MGGELTSLTYLLSSPPPSLSLPIAVESRSRTFTVAALISQYLVAGPSVPVRFYTLIYVEVQNHKLRGKNWGFDEKKGEESRGYRSSADVENAQRLGCHSRHSRLRAEVRPHQATASAVSCLGEFKHRMHPDTSKTKAEMSRLRRAPQWPNLSAH